MNKNSFYNTFVLYINLIYLTLLSRKRLKEIRRIFSILEEEKKIDWENMLEYARERRDSIFDILNHAHKSHTNKIPIWILHNILNHWDDLVEDICIMKDQEIKNLILKISNLNL